MPEIGQPAPEFSLPDGDGNLVSLASFRGRPVVLYFYPKDMTPGCTQEACDFRDRYDRLQAAGAVLLGISPDPAKSHARFAARYTLPFPLLADEQHSVADAFGVWKEKRMYGRSYMGIERSTFLIDAGGRIAQVWSGVRVPGHAEAVLEALSGHRPA
jgi:peroxiredoxin Q/BCP